MTRISQIYLQVLCRNVIKTNFVEIHDIRFWRPIKLIIYTSG